MDLEWNDAFLLRVWWRLQKIPPKGNIKTSPGRKLRKDCLQDHVETIDGGCPRDARLFCHPRKHRKVPLRSFWKFQHRLFNTLHAVHVLGDVFCHCVADLFFKKASICFMEKVPQNGSWHMWKPYVWSFFQIHLFPGLSMDFPIAWQVH